jgi:hypothetical protein
MQRMDLLALALLAGGCTQREESTTDRAWFVECARESGLTFEHVAGEPRQRLPEIMCGGVGLLDFDGDGDLDVYCVQGGDPELGRRHGATNRLFRNLGDGRFEDVTEAAGVGDGSYGMGCAAGDIDSDGDVDLYVTNLGANVLYENEGDGTFTDVSVAAGVGDESWSSSACFADYDGDGDYDLFVANYVRWSPAIEVECFSPGKRRDYCHPNVYRAPARDTLYRNEGDGRFRDVTAELGLDSTWGNALGVVAGDFDGDGRGDFYVSNDMTPNQLWIQQPDGRFVDRGLISGSALSGTGFPEAGMGVCAVDIEADGDLDLFCVHLRHQKNTFYENLGRGSFEDAGAALGLSAPSLPFTGFGVGLSDFDQDGDLDLYVANGRVAIEPPELDPADPYAEPDLLFERTAPGRFQERLPRGGAVPTRIGTSRGAAFGDLDGDGDTDVVVIDRNAPARLLRNKIGDGRNWVLLRILDRNGADALGAVVSARMGETVSVGRVQAGYGYCSSNDPRVHFGLGARHQVDELRVRWSDGTSEHFGPLAAGAVHVIKTGAGR